MEPEEQITTQQIYELLLKEQQQAQKRFWSLTTGAALAFGTLLPGLGMLFLRWYKWSLIYFGLAAALLSKALRPGPERLGWFAFLGLVWLVSIIHSGLAADYSADRSEGRPLP